MRNALFHIGICLTLMFGVQFCSAAVIRVNLSPVATAPFSDLQLAVDAALQGDTIMVEALLTSDLLPAGLSWNSVIVDKELTFMGPGYFLDENIPGLAELQHVESIPNFLVTTNGANTKITGLHIQSLHIQGDQVTVEKSLVHHAFYDNATAGLMTRSFLSGNNPLLPVVEVIGGSGHTFSFSHLGHDPLFTSGMFAVVETSSSGNIYDHNVVSYGDILAYGATYTNSIFDNSTFLDLEGGTFSNNLFANPSPVALFDLFGNPIDGSPLLGDTTNILGVDLGLVFTGSGTTDTVWDLIPSSLAEGYGNDGLNAGMFTGPNGYLPGGGLIDLIFDQLVWTDCNQGQIFMPVSFTGISVDGLSLIDGFEWFVDADPGIGNGTFVQTQPGSISQGFVGIDLNFVADGLHSLGLRLHTATDDWGPALEVPFKKLLPLPIPNLTGVEFILDDDGGFGNGLFIANPIPDVNVGDFIASLGSELDPGVHDIGVRAQDENGEWGVTHFEPYLVLELPQPPPLTVGLEYYFDDDPGFGLGLDFLTIVDDQLVLTAPLTGLTPGVHDLHLRVLDSEGNWSVTLVKTLLVVETSQPLPDLVAFEYFFDTDPGIGNATSLPITPLPDFDGTLSIPLVGLSPGPHTLFVRSQDANGDVGTTYYHVIEVSPEFGPDCADFNNDQVISTADLLVLLSFFGSTANGCDEGDLNGDGVVSAADLLIFLAYFGSSY